MKIFPKQDNIKHSFRGNVTDLKIGDTSNVINYFHFPPVKISKIKRRKIWVRNIEKKWSAFTSHPSLRLVHWHSIHLPGWTFLLSSCSTHSCSEFTFPELSYTLSTAVLDFVFIVISIDRWPTSVNTHLCNYLVSSYSRWWKITFSFLWRERTEDNFLFVTLISKITLIWLYFSWFYLHNILYALIIIFALSETL